MLVARSLGRQQLIDATHDDGDPRNVAVADGTQVPQIPHVTADEAHGLERLLRECAHDGGCPLGEALLPAIYRQSITEIVRQDDIGRPEHLVLDEPIDTDESISDRKAV